MKGKILFIVCCLSAVSSVANASLLSVNNLSSTDPPPKVSISSAEVNTTYSNPIQLNASFSKLITGFSAEDIQVANGTVTSFKQTVAYSATLGPDVANDESLMFFHAIDFDKEGNLYAVDVRAHQVKVFDSQHNFIRALGIGKAGNENQAFNTPTDITFDQQGNLYVVDQGNFRVQVFDQNLEYMATIGSGQTGYDNNDLNSPKHIAVDQEGRVFVTNAHTHKIQVFNSDYSYLTTLGNENLGSEAGWFNRPGSMTVDASGNIYIADEGNHRVQIYDNNLQYIKMIGGGSQGSEPGKFKVPVDIDIDDKGYIYVADRDNYDIRIFDQDLNPVQIIGTTGNGNLSETSLSPGYIALDHNNNIYCTDLTQRIKVFDQTYSLVNTIEGGIVGSGEYQFRQPGDVAFDKVQNVYVADLYNFRIQIYDQELKFIRSLDLSVENNPPLYSILALAVDTRNDIYIGNYGKVLVYDQDANYKTSILPPDWYTEEQKRNFYPQSIKFNSKGHVHIGDWANNFVLIYDQDFNFLNAVGSGEMGDGDYQFNSPTDMAIDGTDNIYVANLSNGRVQKFDSNGQYLSSFYPKDISNASINNVNFVVVDSVGNIYISDSENRAVQVFDQDYKYVNTIGDPRVTGTSNDVFTAPRGVAIDHQNRIYITDANRIQRFEALTDYQFEVTPAGEGTVEIDIPAGVAVDASSNPNEAAESFTLTYDKRPEVTLSEATFDVQERIFTLSISFNEPVSGFSAADITISNGSISHLQTTDSLTFNATVTPTGDGEIQLSVAENVAFDLAGNGNLASEALSLAYDGILPSATFNTKLPSLTNQSPIVVDLTFNEQLSNLSKDDFQLSNASISSLGVAQPVYDSTIGSQNDVVVENANLFNRPVEVHTDSKNWVYVADQGNHRIQIYDDQLNHVKTFEGVSEYPNYEQFSLPSDVASDSEGRIYVADAYTQAVQIYDLNFNHVGYIPVGFGSDGGNSHYEMSIDVDQKGNIYIASTYNNNLIILDKNQQLLATIDRDSSGNRWFIEPTDVKIDHAGNIYATSTYNYRMLVFDANLKHKATLDTRPFISHPQSIDIDNSGNIYIVDSRENAIQVFSAAFEYLYTIGNEKGINYDQLSNPQGIAINENGHIYVADQDNHRIQVFTPPVKYQLEITPAADGEVVVELPAKVTTDLFGNGNEAARFSITYDGSGPLATFSSADSLSNQPEVEVEISFDEQVSGLQASNFIMTNATLANLQTSDSIHFTAQLRAEQEGYFSITLDSASVRDGVGNFNTQSAGLLLQYRILRDTLAPSVEIRSTVRDTVEGEFVVDMVFSEKVSSFVSGDITLSNASLLSLSTSDSTVFTATVTPLAKGMLSLSLGENVATDSAGNGNLASDTFNIYYDEKYTLSLQVTTEVETAIGEFTATLYQRVNSKYISFISREITEGNAVQFDKLPEGEYTLGIQPADASLLTTYLGGKLLLAEAQDFYLDRNATQSITFISAAVEQYEGIASISGVLLKNEETTSGGRIVSGTQQLNGTPLANVKVYLLNADTEQIIASDVTDEEGRFSFTQLPQGEYLMVADHEGLPNDKQANRINIAPETALLSLTAIVGTDVRIAQLQEEKQITSVNEGVFSRIRYYPNPVIDLLTLEISLHWLNGKMTIHDKLGRQLISTTLTSQSSEVDFTHLPAGVYIVSILKGKSYHSFKISK